MSVKPRIFINIHYLEIGGAETSLIGLLKALNPDKVDVDLFLNAHRGEMMRYIPEWINVLPEISAYSVIESPMAEAARKGHFVVVAARMIAKLHHWIHSRMDRTQDGSGIFGYIGKYVTAVLPSLKKFGDYDLAISFLTPHDVVLRKVSAKKKICWIHTDYSKICVNSTLELPVWSGYDYIVSISNDVTRNFLNVFPSLKDKIIEIENIISPDFVKSRSVCAGTPDEMKREAGEVILLTVGRYSHAKRLDAIPSICRRLTDMGLDVKWYIIGYGGNDDYIKDAVTRENVGGRVVLLGKRENPYPYIKACDWYVQPSRYEGKSVVVREAQILCKPVIVTDYPTAASQIRNGIDGVIVPMEVGDCAEAIYAAIKDEALTKRVVSYLSSHDFGNEKEVNKIYNLILA